MLYSSSIFIEVKFACAENNIIAINCKILMGVIINLISFDPLTIFTIPIIRRASMVKCRKWILKSHFSGLPKREDLEIVEEELPPLKDGGEPN